MPLLHSFFRSNPWWGLCLLPGPFLYTSIAHIKGFHTSLIHAYTEMLQIATKLLYLSCFPPPPLFPSWALSVYVQISWPAFSIFKSLTNLLVSVLNGCIRIYFTLYGYLGCFLFCITPQASVSLEHISVFVHFTSTSVRDSCRWNCKGQGISRGIFILWNECRLSLLSGKLPPSSSAACTPGEGYGARYTSSSQCTHLLTRMTNFV